MPKKSILLTATRRLAGCLAASAVIVTSSATAASLSWTSTGDSTLGGTGTWDTSSALWWNGSSAQAWSTNTVTGDTAVFAGTAGTVTLGTAVNALGLTFSTAGYTITGSTIGVGGGGIDASTLTSGTTTINSNLTAAKGYQQWRVGAGGTLDLSGSTVTRSAGTGVNFGTTGTIKTALTNTNGILGGWATVGNSGVSMATGDWAAVDGSGNVVTYSGYTAISNTGNSTQALDGTTATQNWKTSNATSGSNGNGYVTTLSNSGTINSLVVQGDVIVGNGNTLTLGSGGLILSGISRWIKGPNGNTSDTGQLTSGLASGELFIDVASSASDASNWRIWTKIVDNGGTAVSVVKNGPGYLEVANTGTYTGNTYLNSGTLAAGITNAFGTTGTLYLNGGTLTNGNAGANVDLPNNIVVSGSNAIQLGVAKNLGLNGGISGSGSLTLGNNNQNSTIYLGGANTMTSGTITLVNNTNSVRFSNAVAGNANVAWVFNNTSANKDTLDFASGGTISFGSMTGSGLIQGNGAGTRTISAGNLGQDDTFSGHINNGSGTTALTKVGVGTMTLSSTNDYSGGTTINGGKLNVTGSISGNGAVAVSGGTSATLGGSGTVAGAVTVTNGSRLAPGVVTSSSNFGSAGTLTLSNTASGLALTNANLDFDLSTTFNGTNDKIALGSAAALTFTTLNFSFSGTTLDTTAAYTLVSTTGSLTSGTLGSITTDFSSVTGGSYTATYNFVAGTGLQVSFTAVPEPHEFAIAIVALLGVMIFVRRRNEQRA